MSNRAAEKSIKVGDGSALQVSALRYATRGWQILPCWPDLNVEEGGHRTGPKAKSPHTTHGHLDASSDPKVVADWWIRWPDAMIGGVVPRNCIVLDLDPRHDGNLAELEQLVGPLPVTLTTISGRLDGGKHLWFRRPLGEVVSTRLPDGWDLKVNGYVILPPSIHPISGQPYRWERHPVAPLPMELWQLLRPLPPAQRTLDVKVSGHGSGLVRTVMQAQPRRRNKALFWAACRAAEQGLNLEAELTEAALGVGLSEIEIARTLASARGR